MSSKPGAGHHWNMRNIVFGFEHLEHRYRVLTKLEPPQIPVEARLNLNDVFKERYGSDYAPHPRMKNLMLLNGERDKSFLTGDQESAAFKNGEFIRMNSSTISKVEFFRFALIQAQHGKLRTAGRKIVNYIDRLLDNRWARVSALLVTLTALATALYKIALFLYSFPGA